jgi:hypothetical protein
MGRQVAHASAALVLLLGSWGCGGSSKPSTSEPTAVVTPGPTSHPTAVPNPPVAALSACARLGDVATRPICSAAHGKLAGEVSAAIDRLIVQQPALFSLKETNEAGDPYVVNPDGYLTGLVQALDTAGICAQREGNGLGLLVKDSNDFSESYQPINSRRYPWRGLGSYAETCVPASFPQAAIDHVDWIFVTAYSYNCDPGAGLLNPPVKGSKPELPMGCEAYVTATPKTAEGRDVPISVHGSEILWEIAQGDVVWWQWDWQPFNLTVSARGAGPLVICATVDGVRGCAYGAVVP